MPDGKRKCKTQEREKKNRKKSKTQRENSKEKRNEVAIRFRRHSNLNVGEEKGYTEYNNKEEYSRVYSICHLNRTL